MLFYAGAGAVTQHQPYCFQRPKNSCHTETGSQSATDYIFAPYSSLIALGRCGRVRIETDLLVDA